VAVFVWGDAKFSGTPLVIYLLPSIAKISLTTITIIERRGAACITPMLPIMTSLFWQLLGTLICLAPLAYWVEGFAADWTLPFVFNCLAWGCGVDFVIFLDAAFDPSTQCSARIIFAIFRAPGYDADRIASLWRGA